MSKHEDNRVLARAGARELTIEEIDYVGAAQIAHTNVCSAVMLTQTGDGDACSDTDHSSHFV
jgi:hypothetical protein